MEDEVLKKLAEFGVRIEQLEKQMNQITDLTNAVNRMAVTMENMVSQQKDMNQRLRQIEQAPADNWNAATRTVITALIGAIVGALMASIIPLMGG